MLNQDNPPFCIEDLNLLKKNKDKFTTQINIITTMLIQKLKNDCKDVTLYILANILPFFRLIENDDSIKLLEDLSNELTEYKVNNVGGFLLNHSESIDGMTLVELASLEQEEFNNLDIDKYIPYLFPCVNQNNPTFTTENLEQFKKCKGNYSLFESTKAIVKKLLKKYNININNENDEINIGIEDIDEEKLKYLSSILQRAYNFNNEIENELDLRIYLNNTISQLDRIIYSTKKYEKNNDVINERIGKGGFGKVFKVEHNGITMARKEIQINSVNLNKVINEINIMKEMRHRNVLICYDQIYDVDNKLFFIYTQYFRYDLSKKIREMKYNKKEFSIYVLYIIIFIFYSF